MMLDFTQITYAMFKILLTIGGRNMNIYYHLKTGRIKKKKKKKERQTSLALLYGKQLPIHSLFILSFK
jgi:hypothetical protein